MKPISKINTNKGAVMPIALIMMLLISTLGLSSVQSSKLESLMSRNMAQKTITFNRAESSALIGETQWDASLVTCLSNIANCADATILSLTPPQVDVSAIDWPANGILAQSTTTGTNSIDYGQYFVEYLSKRPIPGEAEKFVHYYRITARGEIVGSSQSIVQIIYRRCLKVDGVPCPAPPTAPTT